MSAYIVINKVPSYIPISPTVTQDSRSQFSWNSPASSYAIFSVVNFTIEYYDLGEIAQTITRSSTSSSGSISISDASDIVRITAQFSYSNYARTVTLNANGGTISSSSSWSGSGSTATKSVNNGSTYGTLPSGTPVTPQAGDTIKRTGYYFNGWYTTAGGGTQITASTQVGLVGNTTFYANWAYSIQYNANGGSGAPATQVAAIGGSITIPLTVPTKSGYRFTGWNTASNGSGTSYSPGQTISNGTNTVLYAQWSTETYINVYSNNQWVTGQVKVYDGSSWQDATVKTYNGSSWV